MKKMDDWDGWMMGMIRMIGGANAGMPTCCNAGMRKGDDLDGGMETHGAGWASHHG